MKMLFTFLCRSAKRKKKKSHVILPLKDSRLLHYRKNIAVDLGLQNEAELNLEMADKLTSFQAVERDMVHALWLASPEFVNHLVDLPWSNSGAQGYLNTKEICAPPGAFCK